MTPTREQWIDQRVDQLLEHQVADLFDDIFAHDGLASRGFRGYLKIWHTSQSKIAAAEAAESACQILRAFAFMRACREYNLKPITEPPCTTPCATPFLRLLPSSSSTALRII